uniref:Uncharacterized protein n=1 Tax=Rhizophora mucronata TaxID=61149 RepID=A0A2P2PUI1_RHIMU
MLCTFFIYIYILFPRTLYYIHSCFDC